MKYKRIVCSLVLFAIGSTLTGCAFKDQVQNNNISGKFIDGTLNYQKHKVKFKDVPDKLKDTMKDTTDNPFK